MATAHAAQGIKKYWLLSSLLLLTLGLALWVIWRLDNAPRTDDAYAYADTISVTPEVNGAIIELPIQDNQEVQAGDILFRIDPRTYQNALARAQATLLSLDKEITLTQRSVDAQQFGADAAHANIARVQANASQASVTLQRLEAMAKRGFISAEVLDQNRTAQRSAQAQLSTAILQAQQASAGVSGIDALVAKRLVTQAEITQAELDIERTTVRAPFKGRVIGLEVATGHFASAGRPVFTLADTRHWYVLANFRETELKNMHPGAPALVYLMSDPTQQFKGRIESIGYGVYPDDGGSEVDGLPKISRSINWVRVAQRFPVRILIEQPNAELFRIGASAVAVINTATTANAE